MWTLAQSKNRNLREIKAHCTRLTFKKDHSKNLIRGWRGGWATVDICQSLTWEAMPVSYVWKDDGGFLCHGNRRKTVWECRYITEGWDGRFWWWTRKERQGWTHSSEVQQLCDGISVLTNWRGLWVQQSLDRRFGHRKLKCFFGWSRGHVGHTIQWGVI